MWSYDDSRAALRDVLRLSRAMTFKAAVADLPLGGGKGGDHDSRHEPALLGAAATPRCSTSPTRCRPSTGRYITAEDVGTSSRDMSVIASARATSAGLSRRGAGSRSQPVHRAGVESAIRACCRARVLGLGLVARPDVAVIGLGNVGHGWPSGAPGRRDSCSSATSMSQAPAIRGARSHWATPRTRWRPISRSWLPARSAACSTMRPSQLRCRVIAGAANNQLAEDHIADVLAARQILWAPDFVVNAGGMINIAEELGGTTRRPRAAGSRGIADTLRKIFDDAEAMGATPLTAAMELRAAGLAALDLPDLPRRGRALDALGSRPSSSSLFRCAASVTAAAGRTAAARRPDRVQELVHRAPPPSSAAISRRSRSSRCEMYDRAWPPDRGPAVRGPGEARRARGPGPSRSIQVAGQRPGSGAINTLPSPARRRRSSADRPRRRSGRGHDRGSGQPRAALSSPRGPDACRHRPGQRRAGRPGIVPHRRHRPGCDRRGRGSRRSPPSPPRASSPA